MEELDILSIMAALIWAQSKNFDKSYTVDAAAKKAADLYVAVVKVKKELVVRVNEAQARR